MERITLAPDNDGLIRWLRHVYKTDPLVAVRIIRSGWEALTAQQATDILTNRLQLVDALTPPEGKC